jgi:PAS domain S-box-containing protein
MQTTGLFQKLYDSNVIGIIVTDIEGSIIRANKKFLDLVGYSKKDVEKGKVKWEKLADEECRKQIVKAIKRYLKRGTFKSYEQEFACKDGSKSTVLVEGILHDPNSDEIIVLVYDITERKQFEEQKDVFLGMAGHELKTPMTSIKGYGQLLKKKLEDHKDEESLTVLSKMNSQVERLIGLVNDLLDVTKIQTGSMPFVFKKFKFDELVYQIVEDVQKTTKTHTIRIEGSTKKVINGDQNRIAQVIVNFLTNAIKYSPEANEIIVKMSSNSDELFFWVTDYGFGIPKSKLDRIFDKFYRVEKTEQRHRSGLGLGLHISLEIIKKHGGDIWVESKVGKGSTFYFSLPLK